MILRFNEFAYFLLDGGRGGAKSQSIARFLLYLGERYKLRICCGRETQNSIDESVHAILKDIIIENNLAYNVFASKIVHKTSGTTFIFKGFRDQGKVNIKGLEGVDILWIDESQSVTKDTLDIIIPTIRKEKSKVFFSMNRYKKQDAVYKDFSDRKDCLHIKINYYDNPHCPKKLLKEAAIEKAKGEDGDYKYIWEGFPKEDADNFLFTTSEIENTPHFEFHYKEALYGYRIGAFDIARMGADHCSFVVLEQKGPMQWEEIHHERWKKKDLAHSTGRIVDRTATWNLDKAVVDGDGLGAGPRDISNFFSNKDIVEFRAQFPAPDDINLKTGQKRLTRRHDGLKCWSWHQVKDMIENEWLKVKTQYILNDLENIMYDFKPNGVRFIVSKKIMKKMGFPSSDDGDALMMAVSEIRNVSKVYEKQGDALPAYTIMDDNDNSSGNILQRERLPGYCEGM